MFKSCENYLEKRDCKVIVMYTGFPSGGKSHDGYIIER
uniref:Uncharacterized protein n=1 Tax=Anguilla anguilla TaxID=7936 RepID=A0A0E9PAF3_ANGAN